MCVVCIGYMHICMKMCIHVLSAHEGLSVFEGPRLNSALPPPPHYSSTKFTKGESLNKTQSSPIWLVLVASSLHGPCLYLPRLVTDRLPSFLHIHVGSLSQNLTAKPSP